MGKLTKLGRRIRKRKTESSLLNRDQNVDNSDGTEELVESLERGRKISIDSSPGTDFENVKARKDTEKPNNHFVESLFRGDKKEPYLATVSRQHGQKKVRKKMKITKRN